MWDHNSPELHLVVQATASSETEPPSLAKQTQHQFKARVVIKEASESGRAA